MLNFFKSNKTDVDIDAGRLRREQVLNSKDELSDSQIRSRELTLNGIVSEMTGIGSGDSTSSFTPAYIHMPPEDAELAYEGSGLISRLIDEPANDALRNGYKIETGDVAANEAIEKRLRELDINHVLLTLLQDSSIYSEGALFYPVLKEAGGSKSREHLSRPLKKGTKTRIEDINIITPPDFSIVSADFSREKGLTERPLDPAAKGYNKVPAVYFSSTVVDQSRYVICMEGKYNKRRYKSISMIEKAFKAVIGLAIAQELSTKIMNKAGLLTFTYPVDDRTLTKAGLEARDQATARIKNNASFESVIMIPNDFDIKWVSAPSSGIRDATEFLWQYLCAVTNRPRSKILGSQQGVIQAGARDMADYYAMVEGNFQERRVARCLRHLVNLIIREHGADPCLEKVEIDSFKIEFNSLWTLSEMEKSNIEGRDVSTVQQAVNVGLMTPEEGRAKLYPELGDIEHLDGQDCLGEREKVALTERLIGNAEASHGIS